MTRPFTIELQQDLSRTACAGIFLAGLGILGARTVAGCGGTTGREGIPSPIEQADATIVDAGPDAVTSDASNSQDYDATIEYADAARLDGYEASVDAGASNADSGEPLWPDCACDSFDQFGRLVADDAGVCPTYAWLGSSACDDCMRANGFSYGINNLPFPPCCNYRGVNDQVASGGPKAGASRYKLCVDLFTCFQRAMPHEATLAAPDAHDFYCGEGVTSDDCVKPGGPKGPCKNEVEAAYETTAQADIYAYFISPDFFPTVGAAGEQIGSLFQTGVIGQIKNGPQPNGCSDVCYTNADGGDGG